VPDTSLTSQASPQVPAYFTPIAYPNSWDLPISHIFSHYLSQIACLDHFANPDPFTSHITPGVTLCDWSHCPVTPIGYDLSLESEDTGKPLYVRVCNEQILVKKERAAGGQRTFPIGLSASPFRRRSFPSGPSRPLCRFPAPNSHRNTRFPCDWMLSAGQFPVISCAFRRLPSFQVISHRCDRFKCSRDPLSLFKHSCALGCRKSRQDA
jgi:hypothetical protein